MKGRDDAPVAPGSGDPTLAALLNLADAKLGSRHAVLLAIPVSRQRLDSAMRGGPPLRAERLLRLALIADVDPAEALRAGGREPLATLLDAAYGPERGGVTAPQRSLLRRFDALGHDAQRLAVRLVAALAADRLDARSSTLHPMPKEAAS
jgi:hypothetical protein